jgi:hypothetical protein
MPWHGMMLLTAENPDQFLVFHDAPWGGGNAVPKRDIPRLEAGFEGR